MTKTILITGGAKRIGAELAHSLHAQSWQMALHYHHSQTEAEALQAELGDACQLFQADLTNEAATEELIPRVLAGCGGLDAVIHNASLFEKDGWEDFTWQTLDAHMRVHCYASLSLAKHFHAQRKTLKADSPAPLILLGDGLKGWSHSPAFLSYGVSRSAMESLPALLGESLAPELRINMLALGLSLPRPEDDPEMFARVAAKTPLQRESNPSEILDAVNWLLDAQSVTGQVISLAGGQHLTRRI